MIRKAHGAGLMVCLDGSVPVAQDHLATIRKAVGAVLHRHGFRTDSPRLWRRGDDVEGWLVVAWQGDKWNTKTAAEASLSVAVWPPGTREHLGELRGREVEPFVAANAPVLGTGRKVTGDPTADTYPVAADMADDELAEQVRRAEAFAEVMVAWAVTMLDARVSAPSMRDGNAVAALLAGHPDWPGLDPTLDRLTAAFQRDPRPIELHPRDPALAPRARPPGGPPAGLVALRVRPLRQPNARLAASRAARGHRHRGGVQVRRRHHAAAAGRGPAGRGPDPAVAGREPAHAPARWRAPRAARVVALRRLARHPGATRDGCPAASLALAEQQVTREGDDGRTANPAVGATEVCEFYNTTGDAPPVHNRD